jgi:FHS family L-fucose permease-like MFS transporter
LGDYESIGIHNSYIIAAISFALLAFIALKLRSVLRVQGLDFDKQIGGSH